MLIQYLPLLRQKHIVLASSSPRRQEILKLLNIEFEVLSSGFPENLDPLEFDSPASYAIENAKKKASYALKKLKEKGHVEVDLVIGADTIVVVDNIILEKPQSEAGAADMLQSLSGRRHLVYSGVCLYWRSPRDCSTNNYTCFSETTEVEMAKLSLPEISAYIRTKEPFDKSGAYGIQGIGGCLVKGIDGCYFNVMGFPMHHFASAIAELCESGQF
eukprot:jgi/Galph1/64/GphlegSOOS_G4808.1